MSIVDDIEELAAKEREIRRLENLITLVSTLSDDELAKVWPRIHVAGPALTSGSSSPETVPPSEPSQLQTAKPSFLPRNLSAIPHRFRILFSKA